MGTRIIDKLVMVAVVVVLSMALAIPAGAGPKVEVTDFTTNALDAEGNFRLVECSKADQITDKFGKIKEIYHCAFVSDGFWGTPVIPVTKMHWDYASSDGLADDTIIGLEGPYRWFSDIEDISSSGDLCWMYSNNWRMELEPSGQVQVKVEYSPPVIEGPDCTFACALALP